MIKVAKCKRCWECCIAAIYDNIFLYNRVLKQFSNPHKFPIPILAMSDTQPMIMICSMQSANEELQPVCMIYNEKPTWCNEYTCEKMK